MRYWDAWARDPADPAQGWAEECLVVKLAAEVSDLSEDMRRVLDQGVQLHGGYGYITEYPIARAFLDARVHRIYGGTNEIMREIVARAVTGRK